MTDYPDIYADGFSDTAGNYGVTITLRLSQPSGEPGPHQDPSDILARIRLAPNTAMAIADATTRTQTVVEAKGDPKTTPNSSSEPPITHLDPLLSRFAHPLHGYAAGGHQRSRLNRVRDAALLD